MKALSVLQPWAYLLANGWKDIENRSWRTAYRGRFAIHAGKRWGAEQRHDLDHLMRQFPQIPLPPAGEFERGGIVGIASVTDCVTNSASPWFAGRYGFCVSDARPVPFLAVQGKLNFFDVPDSLFSQPFAHSAAEKVTRSYVVSFTLQLGIFFALRDGKCVAVEEPDALRFPTSTLATRWAIHVEDLMDCACTVLPSPLLPTVPFSPGATCLHCGCTKSFACPDRCHWAAPLVCSCCLPQIEAKKAARNLWLSTG